MKIEKRLYFVVIALIFSLALSLSLAACDEIDLALGIAEEYLALTEESTPSSQLYTSDDIRMAQVVRVVDGDTAVFNDGGNDFRVRFIAIDAPEMGFHNSDYEPGATESTEFAKELLPEGREVYLVIGTPAEDRFGRARAYIWLDDPKTSEPQESMLNAQLLENGHAEVSIHNPTTYENLFFELEAQAKDQGLGMWGR